MRNNDKENNQKNPSCSCDKDCKCGCQEGKECTCGQKCDCGCRCGCHCKSCAFKLLGLILVFLAGMGFNELLHGGCFGRCPMKNRSMPMLKMPAMIHNMPNYKHDDGKTVIIINAAEGSVSKHHCDSHKNKHHNGHHFKPGKMPAPARGDNPEAVSESSEQ